MALSRTYEAYCIDVVCAQIHRLTVYGLEKPASLCASSSQASAAVWLLLCSLVSGLRLTEVSPDFTGALTAGRTLGSTLLLPQSAHTCSTGLITTGFHMYVVSCKLV